jgi:hypothetical protein
MTRFYPCPFVSDNSLFSLPVVRPLWWEDGAVTYSAIADWSGHWGPITTHYRLIWDCVPSLSPLTTRRDYGGGILTRLHTGFSWVNLRCTFHLISYKRNLWIAASTEMKIYTGIIRFVTLSGSAPLTHCNSLKNWTSCGMVTLKIVLDILCYLYWKPKLKNQIRHPLPGNSSANVSMATNWRERSNKYVRNDREKFRSSVFNAAFV